jgi:hypothetical protein
VRRRRPAWAPRRRPARPNAPPARLGRNAVRRSAGTARRIKVQALYDPTLASGLRPGALPGSRSPGGEAIRTPGRPKIPRSTDARARRAAYARAVAGAAGGARSAPARGCSPARPAPAQASGARAARGGTTCHERSSTRCFGRPRRPTEGRTRAPRVPGRRPPPSTRRRSPAARRWSAVRPPWPAAGAGHCPVAWAAGRCSRERWLRRRRRSSLPASRWLHQRATARPRRRRRGRERPERWCTSSTPTPRT